MTDPEVVSTAKASIKKPHLAPFDVCVTRSDTAVRQALGQILAGLSGLALDAEETATVELVLAEAMNNIVEHAYPADRAEGLIRIRCRQKQNGLHFTIKDRGKPMPDGKMPLGLAQNVNVDPLELSEGGYGWFLIQDLAKDVQYQRVGQENRLDLRIAVAIPHPVN